MYLISKIAMSESECTGPNDIVGCGLDYLLPVSSRLARDKRPGSRSDDFVQCACAFVLVPVIPDSIPFGVPSSSRPMNGLSNYLAGHLSSLNPLSPFPKLLTLAPTTSPTDPSVWLWLGSRLDRDVYAAKRHCDNIYYGHGLHRLRACQLTE